ncbi:MAG: hypothetical protein MJ194_01965 [Clostridia bacterium]|nr:hypothetical protein [Clostridia bacterium]
MNYVKLKNGDSFSALTLSIRKLGKLAETEAVQLIKTAKKHGVDCLDMYAENAVAFVNTQEAIKGSTADYTMIVHFGPDYSKGDVRHVSEMSLIMNSVTAQMQALRIDRLDYACLDCPKGLEDLETAKAKGTLPMMTELKDARVISNLCAYTEEPQAVEELLATGLFAFVMLKSETGTVIYEDAGKAVSEVKAPADLVDLHSMLKEYKV